MSSSPEFGVALGVGEHRPPDDIRQVTFEAPERVQPGFALGNPARHVRLGPGIGPGLGEGDRVEGSVELSVATPVEAVPTGLTRGGRDRRGAAHQGERWCRADATRITRLTQELGRGESSHTSDSWQARARELHECANATLERVGLDVERSKPHEFRSGELSPHTAHTPQEPSHRREVAGRAEVLYLVLVPGSEDDEVGVELVRDPGSLSEAVLPRVDEEFQVLRDPGHGGRAKAPLAKGHSSDRERVAWIALARPAQVPTLAIREDRGYLDDPLTGGREAAQAMSVLRPHLR